MKISIYFFNIKSEIVLYLSSEENGRKGSGYSLDLAFNAYNIIYSQ